MFGRVYIGLYSATVAPWTVHRYHESALPLTHHYASLRSGQGRPQEPGISLLPPTCMGGCPSCWLQCFSSEQLGCSLAANIQNVSFRQKDWTAQVTISGAYYEVQAAASCSCSHNHPCQNFNMLLLTFIHTCDKNAPRVFEHNMTNMADVSKCISLISICFLPSTEPLILFQCPCSACCSHPWFRSSCGKLGNAHLHSIHLSWRQRHLRAFGGQGGHLARPSRMNIPWIQNTSLP